MSEANSIISELEHYFDRLFPINRSLTGNGNRETLKILSEIIDLKIYEVQSGTKCFDWSVPAEWNVREAWIKDSSGKTVVDFNNHNLHLMGYSAPFKGRISLEELDGHLHSIPEMPDSIPYRTSYYQGNWGFCLKHNQRMELNNDEYEVLIDSTFDQQGSMTYGEAYIQGKSEKEILFSTYICHPSLANNELSGPLVTAFIYKFLKNKELTYSYRFLFLPETIGAIYYLSRFGEKLKQRLIAGYVVTTIGDDGNFTYKRSRKGDTIADRAIETVLSETETEFCIEDFFPYGSDERQYCSPGFNLPVGSLMRTRYGKYKEYHTSDDNKSFISFAAMDKSIQKYLDVVEVIEKNNTYTNQFPFCEPHLNNKGIFNGRDAYKEKDFMNGILWLLNMADGTNDLITISNKSKIPFKVMAQIADVLLSKNLINQTNSSLIYSNHNHI